MNKLSLLIKVLLWTAASSAVVAVTATFFGVFLGGDPIAIARFWFLLTAPVFLIVYASWQVWVFRSTRKDMVEVWIQSATTPEERSARWALWTNGGWKAVAPHIVGSSLYKSFGAHGPDDFYDTLLAPAAMRPQKPSQAHRSAGSADPDDEDLSPDP